MSDSRDAIAQALAGYFTDDGVRNAFAYMEAAAAVLAVLSDAESEYEQVGWRDNFEPGRDEIVQIDLGPAYAVFVKRSAR